MMAVVNDLFIGESILRYLSVVVVELGPLEFTHIFPLPTVGT